MATRPMVFANPNWDPDAPPPAAMLPGQRPPSAFSDGAAGGPPPAPTQSMAGPAPVFAEPATPDVVARPSELQRQIGATSDRLKAFQQKDANPFGSANNHPGVGGKILHALSVAGNIAGDIFAPGVVENIPGTQMNRLNQEGSLTQRLQSLTEQDTKDKDEASQGRLRDQQADLAGTKADDYTPRTVTKEQAEAINAPELAGTQMTSRDLKDLVKSAGNNNTSDQNNQRTNDTRSDAAAARAAAAAAKPMQRDDHFIKDQQDKYEGRGMSPVEAYNHAYLDWVDTTKTKPGVARANAMNGGRNVTIVNPDNGQVNYDTAAHARASKAEAPQSNEYKAEGALQRDMTSGPDAHANTALVTGLHHADLLDKAVDALQNGDTKAFNRIGNEMHLQMGSDAQTNFNLIRDGVATEVARAYKGGAPDAGEINDFRNSLSGDGSPKQIHNGIATVRAMLRGKSQGLQGQYEQGMKGKPNFVNSQTPSASTGPKVGTVQPGDGGNYRFQGGDPYDKKNWTKEGK